MKAQESKGKIELLIIQLHTIICLDKADPLEDLDAFVSSLSMSSCIRKKNGEDLN
jgi:hypothetical protein